MNKLTITKQTPPRWEVKEGHIIKATFYSENNALDYVERMNEKKEEVNNENGGVYEIVIDLRKSKAEEPKEPNTEEESSVDFSNLTDAQLHNIMQFKSDYFKEFEPADENDMSEKAERMWKRKLEVVKNDRAWQGMVTERFKRLRQSRADRIKNESEEPKKSFLIVLIKALREPSKKLLKKNQRRYTVKLE